MEDKIGTKLVATYEVFEHSLRVSYLSILFAYNLGINCDTITELALGAVFHDLGKLRLNSEILMKKDKLIEDEFEHIKTHSFYSFDTANKLGLSQLVCEICLSHHEDVKEEGYPNGITSDNLYVNIVRLCDIYDALRSDRPYRSAMSCYDALDIMDKEKQKYIISLYNEFKDYVIELECALTENGMLYQELNLKSLKALRFFKVA